MTNPVIGTLTWSITRHDDTTARVSALLDRIRVGALLGHLQMRIKVVCSGVTNESMAPHVRLQFSWRVPDRDDHTQMTPLESDRWIRVPLDDRGIYGEIVAAIEDLMRHEIAESIVFDGQRSPEVRRMHCNHDEHLAVPHDALTDPIHDTQETP